ncbi:MAG: D-glycero-beta-D-manno-heptose 1-phosphate adenylyltransferase [Spirochaetes bacterium]|nr:D-glycero-beta-D-manno-heptose 1-phosphate adenylyltransferase [Spirochaetota bacterium]
MFAAKNYAVVLDRDNTINADPGYLNDPAKVVLLPGAADGIQLLNRFGIRVLVATNQSGVARGFISEPQLAAVNKRITELLAQGGARVEEFFVCPHDDTADCDCRKPKSGLIEQIFDKYRLTRAKTFIAGDRARDLEAGISLNLRGILVGGTAEVPPENTVFRAPTLVELSSFVLETIFEDVIAEKVFLHAEDFLPMLKNARDARKKIIFTNGCFDILHSGHVQLLSQARALGDFLIVGINADASVKRLKGESRPINSEIDRARILAQLPYIDAVVRFTEDTPLALMQLIKPDVHVKGGDYVKEKLPEYKLMQELGREIVILPFRKGYSTTKIIERMAAH